MWIRRYCLLLGDLLQVLMILRRRLKTVLLLELESKRPTRTPGWSAHLQSCCRHLPLRPLASWFLLRLPHSWRLLRRTRAAATGTTSLRRDRALLRREDLASSSLDVRALEKTLRCAMGGAIVDSSMV